MVVEEVIEVGGGLMSEGRDFGLDALRNGECGEDAGDVFIGLGWNMESTKKNNEMCRKSAPSLGESTVVPASAGLPVSAAGDSSWAWLAPQERLNSSPTCCQCSPQLLP